MKNKYNIQKVLFFILLGIVICVVMFFFVDFFWNGIFVEWFTDNFMINKGIVYDDYGNEYYYRVLVWSRIKIMVLFVSIFSTICWIIIIFIASNIRSKSEVKKSVTEASNMIHEYMSNSKNSTDIFPKEYAEIFAQVTEIKSAMERHERIIKEEAKRKNDLIAYLAHDLKTPLTSVIGYLSLLEEAPDIPTEQKAKYVKITLDKALRLESLINEFFEITRYNLQEMYLEKEEIDLHYMLVQMTDEFYPILTAHGNTVEMSVNESEKVFCDPEKLARVFNNILKNAIAYSHQDTVIKIWTSDKDGNKNIYFQNKGKTIPKQKLDMIFEKFFRLDSSRSTNYGGAGLGLAIAKEIVLLHNGTITAQSQNEVTTFCVSLPSN